MKLNRSNPFYDIDLSEESQRYAIDIKENARALFDVTEDLTDAGNGNMTFRSIAESDMPDNVEVEYIGENVHAGSPAKFTIGVRKLATPQTNTGAYLRQNARNLLPALILLTLIYPPLHTNFNLMSQIKTPTQCAG